MAGPRKLRLPLLLWALSGAAAQAQVTNDAIRPGRDEAKLLCVSGDWAVWVVSTPVEAERNFRLSRAVHRFYRQRLSEPDAKFIFEKTSGAIGFRDVRNASFIAVTGDGTLVSTGTYSVQWHGPGGELHVSPAIKGFQQLHPDGVLLKQPSGPAPLKPIVFIPFRGRQLDLERAVEIVPEGMHRPGYTVYPVRHKDAFAWSEPKKLHFFDIRSGIRREVSMPPFQGDHHLFEATAFDGQTLACQAISFDAETGAALGGVEYWKRTHYLVFAVRNRIGYWLRKPLMASRTGMLEAVDLASPDLRAVPLLEAPESPIGQSDEGLTVWTGREWKRLPWLERFPSD
jgi:hypothetical protein